MRFSDGFRAQYFLCELLKSKKELECELFELKNIWPEINIPSISDSIFEELAYQADQIVLPVIVHEIASAKNLPGTTPIERYQSFFLQRGSWTERARSIVSKYPFLMEMINVFIGSSTKNLACIFQRIKEDYQLLRNPKTNFREDCLTAVKLGISDRHINGQQAAILEFSSGSKLIYKPVDLSPNKLFSDFIEILELEHPFNLYVPDVVVKDGYGWTKYVYPHPCQTIDDVKIFYKRAGTLLAAADALNYCDGHMENLIASFGYPTLIDYETLFHAFGETTPDLGERSVLFTGLIEKPPEEESDKGFTAAFQAISVNRYELLLPHAIHDHTDEITLSYRGFASSQCNNSPVFNNIIQTPLRFVDDFVAGFYYGYNRISSKVGKWMDSKKWWDDLKNVKARQLIRHTLYYELLMRKMQQPEGCVSKKAALEIIYPLLFSEDRRLSVVTEYEISEILKLDIPFFYHFPGTSDLYDGSGNCYANYFKLSASEEIWALVQRRSNKYLRRNIEIIKNVLKASPEPININ